MKPLNKHYKEVGARAVIYIANEILEKLFINSPTYKNMFNNSLNPYQV